MTPFAFASIPLIGNGADHEPDGFLIKQTHTTSLLQHQKLRSLRSLLRSLPETRVTGSQGYLDNGNPQRDAGAHLDELGTVSRLDGAFWRSDSRRLPSGRVATGQPVPAVSAATVSRSFREINKQYRQYRLAQVAKAERAVPYFEMFGAALHDVDSCGKPRRPGGPRIWP